PPAQPSVAASAPPPSASTAPRELRPSRTRPSSHTWPYTGRFLRVSAGGVYDRDMTSKRRDPREEPPDSMPEGGSDSSDPAAKSEGRVVTNVDPRLEEIEPAIDRGDWAAVVKSLGPVDAAGRLPPQLGLLFAVAHHETAKEDEKGGANEMAIRCAAGLFGVS